MRLGGKDGSTRGKEAAEHVFYRCGVSIGRVGERSVRIIVVIGSIRGTFSDSANSGLESLYFFGLSPIIFGLESEKVGE